MLLNTMKIIAHRGESFDAPENSLSAILLAWERGAKVVEIDVHLSADKEVVVIHDKHTGRVGDKKRIVKKSSLSELKTVDIGLKKSEKYKGERIPALSEVLETVPPEGKLIIEVKCGNEVINPLIQVLKASAIESTQVELMAFNLKVVGEMKMKAPQFKVVWLLDLDYYFPHWLLVVNARNIIRKVKAGELDGVNVWAGKVLNKAFVKAFKDEGLLFYVWTVNDQHIARKIKGYGVDAITTDRAAWLTRQLAGTKQ